MQRERFIALALTNPVNRTILERLPDLALPDAWLVSGSLFQTVWNTLTGRPAMHGIKDYDIFYFDPDTSWEAEDRVICRCAQTFADLGTTVEVRNQARVHLWYRDKFGPDYPQVKSATGAIDGFLSHVSMVGLGPAVDGFQVYAPHGLGDVETMTVRPNRAGNFQAHRYAAKAARWKAQWPEITIMPAE
jgi:hypothetical protein